MNKYFFVIGISVFHLTVRAQINAEITLNSEVKYQTVEGFGAALAYYENWLIAHPNKADIYEAIFEELSLDILRVRNAYDYDETMIDRVAEFYHAAENSLGYPIKIMSTSWGPPEYLKSNNDRKNGGTLKYQVNGNDVAFDYSGFADWWRAALDEYNENGIYPDYISLQNEPDYEATWESCLFKPEEQITSRDTIAGYNKALEAVFEMVEQRNEKPLILGPETIGIGYNSVQNYVNALDVSKMDGIAHHLYHGVDENDPWESANFTSVGNLHPEIPHYQTEYSRGDWFSLAGLLYKSFAEEHVVAYLYWDLIWDGGGLVNLEFPWDASRWTTNDGYIKTKEFYAFKQFSAFIHPGWERINVIGNYPDLKTLAFMNSGQDTVTVVMVNKSESTDIEVNLNANDLPFTAYDVYRTSEHENCEYVSSISSPNFNLPAKSITTARLTVKESEKAPLGFSNSSLTEDYIVYPNPVSQLVKIRLPEDRDFQTIIISDLHGRVQKEFLIDHVNNSEHEITIDLEGLPSGMFFYKIKSTSGTDVIGRILIE